MFKNGMRPVHPGEVLQEDFLKPLGMSTNALAKALHVRQPFCRRLSSQNLYDRKQLEAEKLHW